ncbi:MAG TPA: Gfo/Idh/MocA family oxidoreductase [Armatimonadota bacterium]|jgi:predicted dehydrogenase
MESQVQKLRVALVGGAHIHTPGFIDALNKRDDVSVVAAWDHDPARAAKCAEALGCPAVSNLAAVWDDPAIGAVIICSETDRHLELVSAAAAAKKHMFAEKPLGINARDSFQMARAIEAAGVHFTTGYFLRTTPEMLFLKRQVENGAFGTVTRVRGSNCHSGSLGGWFDTDYRWMADPKVAGVGAFGDLGTHSLDILMWLFGPISAATADIRIITNRYPNCDETGEALLKFESGVIGTLAAGWVDVENPVSLLISGTEGHAAIIHGQIFFHSSKVDGADGKEPWNDLPEATPRPIEQFLNAAQGKPYDALVSPAEAAARVAVMEAAYQAAETQTWAKVARK